MKKLILLLAVILLAACSDASESTWVAQTIKKEEKAPPPTYDAQVTIQTPISTTTGLVIHKDDREKWILVNAQEVSGHPLALVHEDLMVQGEVQAIDTNHNIALIKIRNSYDFDVLQVVDTPVKGGVDLATKELSYFETTRNNETIQAPASAITALLVQAMKEPLTWQQRFEKNEILQKNATFAPVTNFTTHYDKNLFTYNPDDLKHFATEFITQLNKSIEQEDWQPIETFVGSDEVFSEIQYVTKKVEGLKLKGAKREGVFYFVNGVDKDKREVRLTLIKQQDAFKLIGTNLIDSESLAQEKVALIDLTEKQKIAEMPALEMFINDHIDQIIIKNTQAYWKLQHVEKKIAVTYDMDTDEQLQFSCTNIGIQEVDAENRVQLVGCTNSPQESYLLGTIN